VKLLLDEMFSPAIADHLRQSGHDVVAVKERPDLVQRADSYVFDAAQAEGRVVVTENVRDFRQIAQEESGGRPSHAGVIFTTERAFFRGSRGAIGRLVEALAVVVGSDQPMEGVEVWLKPV
jgi:predicted nuclease of predicted toxin-antitoxin system